MNEKYIQILRDVIRRKHGCASRHSETVPVREAFGETFSEGFGDKIVWQDNVEVFDLAGHPKARQCYAWGFKDEEGKWQYAAVLRIAPVETPLKAVQAYILSRPQR